MRRRIVGGGSLVLAAAVGLTVWLVARSNGPSYFTTPAGAVGSVCHAERTAEFPSSPPLDAVDVTPESRRVYGAVGRAEAHGKTPVIWVGADKKIHIAYARRVAPARYRLVTCDGVTPVKIVGIPS